MGYFKGVVLLMLALQAAAKPAPMAGPGLPYLPPETTPAGYFYETPDITLGTPPPTPKSTPSPPKPPPPPPPPKIQPPPPPPPPKDPPTPPPKNRPPPPPSPPKTPAPPTPPTEEHHHEHHEHGMPFEINYSVKDETFRTDFSENAVSDGEVVRGEYRVALPDGRLQIVRYTADWKNGYNAEVTYEGTAVYPEEAAK